MSEKDGYNRRRNDGGRCLNRGGFGGGGRRNGGLRPIRKINEKGRRIEAFKGLKQGIEADLNLFTLYANYAINNLAAVVGKPDLDRLHDASLEDFRKNLLVEEKSGDAKKQLIDLANFLWAFRKKDPGTMFAPIKKDKNEKPDRTYFPRMTLILFDKIVNLRHFFEHIDQDGNQVLICDAEFHDFIEKILRPEAEAAGFGRGMNPAKLLEKNLFSPRVVGAEAEKVPDDQRTYELTWRGVVFLICLALWKDEAEEFLAGFREFRTPNRRRDRLDGLGVEEIETQRKKCPMAKSMAKAYAHFSFPRRRVLVAQKGEPGYGDYCNFAKLLDYLNKVPPTAFDYLELSEEWDRLSQRLKDDQKKALLEQRLPENNLHRFDLSRKLRVKDRFVSLAAACCEASGMLPSLKFKRLELPDMPAASVDGVPGSSDDAAAHVGEEEKGPCEDPHYVIDRGAIRFEWTPPAPSGGEACVRIKCLRGSLGEQTFCRLLALAVTSSQGGREVDGALNKYLSAYHELLETMLNAEDMTDLSFSNAHLHDLVANVIGGDPLEVSARGKIDDYIPPNVSRFFTPPGKGYKTEYELREDLRQRLEWLIGRCDEFIKRAREWSAAQDLPEARRPAGLSRPPDKVCIARVFDWLNLNIDSPKDAFRQLPPHLRHNGKDRDISFQKAHKAIGLFGTDNKEVWGGSVRSKVDGRMVELKGLAAYNPAIAGRPLRALEETIRDVATRRPELDENGRPRRDVRGKMKLRPYTLTDLAMAATTLCRMRYERVLQILQREGQSLSGDRLREHCRRMGVRAGLPLDRTALVKSILGIDIENWEWAYDRERQCRRETPRQLCEVEHVISQIPVPNSFVERFKLSSRIFERFCRKDREGKEVVFDWSRVFDELARKGVPLRRFYDVAPLVDYVKENLASPEIGWQLEKSRAKGLVRGSESQLARVRHVWQSIGYHPENLEEEEARLKERDPADFSRKGVNRAIREIMIRRNQDILLATFARKYWDGYQQTASFDENRNSMKNGADVYDFFNREVVYPLKGCNAKLRLSRNDVFGTMFAEIVNHRQTVVRLLQAKGSIPPDGTVLYDRAVEAYLEHLHQERRDRLEILKVCADFMRRCPIPKQEYDIISARCGDDEARKQQERLNMEFSWYRKVFPQLTLEQLQNIHAVRNSVVHHDSLDDVKTQFGEVLAVMRSSLDAEQPTARQREISRNFSEKSTWRDKKRPFKS